MKINEHGEKVYSLDEVRHMRRNGVDQKVKWNRSTYEKRLKRTKIFTVISFVISVYIAVSFTVYRFKHPELTNTQLTLHFVDAMTWK